MCRNDAFCGGFGSFFIRSSDLHVRTFSSCATVLVPRWRSSFPENQKGEAPFLTLGAPHKHHGRIFRVRTTFARLTALRNTQSNGRQIWLRMHRVT
jgi:hypothetical protein